MQLLTRREIHLTRFISSKLNVSKTGIRSTTTTTTTTAKTVKSQPLKKKATIKTPLQSIRQRESRPGSTPGSTRLVARKITQSIPNTPQEEKRPFKYGSKPVTPLETPKGTPKLGRRMIPLITTTVPGSPPRSPTKSPAKSPLKSAKRTDTNLKPSKSIMDKLMEHSNTKKLATAIQTTIGKLSPSPQHKIPEINIPDDLTDSSDDSLSDGSDNEEEKEKRRERRRKKLEQLEIPAGALTRRVSVEIVRLLQKQDQPPPPLVRSRRNTIVPDPDKSSRNASIDSSFVHFEPPEIKIDDEFDIENFDRNEDQDISDAEPSSPYINLIEDIIYTDGRSERSGSYMSMESFRTMCKYIERKIIMFIIFKYIFNQKNPPIFDCTLFHLFLSWMIIFA